MDDYIVEMRHITKRFPGIVANDDVSISVRRGEVYALLGENGAGKSTLMSMLFGMYEPDHGTILIDGKPVVFHSSNDAAAHSIGMVHQHFKLVDNYTVAENIVLGIEPMKRRLGFLPWVDLKKANHEISELSEKFGLKVNPTDRIEDLPVSVRQRVEILKMLYRKAEIMIFDEPTAVLTPQEIDFLLQSVQEMADLMVGRRVNFNRDKSEAHFRDTVLAVSGMTVENEHHFEVVKNVTFNVRGGEIFAIAGVSGNGQTEIADAITGLLKLKSGTIRLNGKDITSASVRERAVRGISYIPEDRHGTGVVLDFTLRDNLVLREYFREPFSKNGILNRDSCADYADKLINRYDIRSGQGADTIIRSMSGGNQQKAIIGREIEEHASLIIFVQPTRGLDIGAIENIHNHILAERERGAAILLISLELDEIMKLADTIGIIYRGELLKTAPASEMTSHDVGRYMMGVKEE